MEVGIWKVKDVSIFVEDVFQQDWLEDGKDFRIFTTDSRIQSAEFEDFLELYETYRKYGNYVLLKKGDKELEARFGQLIYSEGEEMFDVRIVFVPKEFDAPMKSRPNFHEKDNLERELATQKAIMERLLLVIESHDILDKETIDSIRSEKGKDIDRNRLNLYAKVENLKTYLVKSEDDLPSLREFFADED